MALRADGITVHFGDHVAVADVSVAVAPGETLALLGPSGCGKSTLLRSIAGLQPIDAGSVAWSEQDLTGVPPHRRGIGLMFQDHALFPHRNVAANVGFGLRMAGTSEPSRTERVDEMLTLVGLADFGERSIDTLSGGEAQRVALARALAPRPRVLLLDEPFGSLDRPLRDRLVGEVPPILHTAEVAAIHVTHDHDEAFSVADEVAIMIAGRILRVGSPREVWSDPQRAEVARFLGHANLVDVGTGGEVPWGSVPLPPGTHVLPADSFAAAAPDDAGLVGIVVRRAFSAGRSRLTIDTEPGGKRLMIDTESGARIGDRIHLTLDASRAARVTPD